jgi:succinate dehydrogenase/fumarate reductase-like Fe-S protein
MTYKLRLSVFRFDAKCDYLPFYKKHIIKIDGDKTVEQLLAVIKEEDRLFDYPTGKNAAIKIGSKNLFTNVKIDDVVSEFGKELTLMPMSEKRAQKDLIVNTDDFYERFDLIDPFVSSSDKKRFEELVIYHYASDTYLYDEDFQGDALFLFAHEMIKKHFGQAGDILDLIDNNETGIWLHTNICGKIFPTDFLVEEKINTLKSEVLARRSQS